MEKITRIDLILEELRRFEHADMKDVMLENYANIDYINEYIDKLREEHNTVEINRLTDKFLELYSESFSHDKFNENEIDVKEHIKAVNTFLNHALKQLAIR